MTIRQKSKKCRTCGRPTLHEQKVEQFGQAFLVLFTCGLWLPIALLAPLYTPWICQSCGRKN